MDFLDALKALKEGKKVKRKDWFHTNWIEFDKTYDENYTDGRFVDVNDFGCGKYIKNTRHFSTYDLLTTDWEIIEDIPEVQIHIDINELFTCQKCGNEQEFWPSMRIKETFECCRCGQKHKMKNKLIGITDRVTVSCFGDGSRKVFLKE